jgi:hypothetical protein
MDTIERLKDKFRNERRPKDKVTLKITLIYALTHTHPKTFT